MGFGLNNIKIPSVLILGSGLMIRTPKARLASAARRYKRRKNRLPKILCKGEETTHTKRSGRLRVAKGVLENRLESAKTERFTIQHELNQLYGARKKKEEELFAEINKTNKTFVKDRVAAAHRTEIRYIDLKIERLERRRDKIINVIGEANSLLENKPDAK